MPSLPNRPQEGLLAWVDALQRRHVVLGFPFAVIRKYGDDGGWRHAALITYYGFLSVFPILLVAASLLSAVLVNRPTLREEMVAALLPEALQSTVNTALAAMPSSGLPLALGIVGLLFSGTGVVFSAYETLNQVAGVPRRSRFPVVARYTRVVLMVIVVLVGGLGIAALTVASGALPDELQRLGASLATALVVFLVLVTAAALLVARPVPLRTSVLPAATGAIVVTLVSGSARACSLRSWRGRARCTGASRRWRGSSRCCISSARRSSTPRRSPSFGTEVCGLARWSCRGRHRPTSWPSPGWRPCRSGFPSSGSRCGSTALTRKAVTTTHDIVSMGGWRPRPAWFTSSPLYDAAGRNVGDG